MLSMVDSDGNATGFVVSDVPAFARPQNSPLAA